jgi:hypothetical protein
LCSEPEARRPGLAGRPEERPVLEISRGVDKQADSLRLALAYRDGVSQALINRNLRNAFAASLSGPVTPERKADLAAQLLSELLAAQAESRINEQTAVNLLTATIISGAPAPGPRPIRKH